MYLGITREHCCRHRRKGNHIQPVKPRKCAGWRPHCRGTDVDKTYALQGCPRGCHSTCRMAPHRSGSCFTNRMIGTTDGLCNPVRQPLSWESCPVRQAPKRTNSWSVVRHWAVAETYYLKARTGHNGKRDPSSEWKAAKVIGWLANCGDITLGRKQGLGHIVNWLSFGPQRIHGALTERAWSSPTLLADVIASKNTVFNESHLMSACSSGSNGGKHKLSRTMCKSQGAETTLCRGCNRCAPFKKATTNLWAPKETPSTGALWADNVATYTFNVAGERPSSRRCWRNSSTAVTGHSEGSVPLYNKAPLIKVYKWFIIRLLIRL